MQFPFKLNIKWIQNIKWITWTTTKKQVFLTKTTKKQVRKVTIKFYFNTNLLKNKRLLSWNILPLSLYFTKCRNDTSYCRCSQCPTSESHHKVSPKMPWSTVGSCTYAKEGFKIIFILLLLHPFCSYSSCSLQPSLWPQQHPFLQHSRPWLRLVLQIQPSWF